MGRVIFGLVVAGAALAVAAPGAGAATITPTTTSDNPVDGCTLREAFEATNFDSVGSSGCVASGGFGDDNIQLPAGTYVLTSGQLVKNSDASSGGGLGIVHSGPGATAVDGNGSSRIFSVLLDATLDLSGFTVQDGFVATGSGGAISTFGDLTLTDMAVVGSESGSVSGDGGGINAFSSATLAMNNVTVSGNETSGNGGGVFSAGTTVARNVTITGNTADTDSAGVGDGGGIALDAGTFSMSNTIVSGNTDTTGQTPDCATSPGLDSDGYNLVGSSTGCVFTAAAGDMIGTPAQLAPLAQNAGSSLTRALQPGSPGIDDGDPAPPGSGGSACLDTDQRGIGRPRGTICDIGAYEAEPPNALTIGALARNKKKGTATLDVGVPYSGQLNPTGTGVNATKAAAVTVGAAGTVKLKIAATGKQKKTLNKKGKVTLTVSLAFDPTNGEPSTTQAKVKLQKKGKKKK